MWLIGKFLVMFTKHFWNKRKIQVSEHNNQNKISSNLIKSLSENVSNKLYTKFKYLTVATCWVSELWTVYVKGAADRWKKISLFQMTFFLTFTRGNSRWLFGKTLTYCVQRLELWFKILFEMLTSLNCLKIASKVQSSRVYVSLFRKIQTKRRLIQI